MASESAMSGDDSGSSLAADGAERVLRAQRDPRVRVKTRVAAIAPMAPWRLSYSWWRFYPAWWSAGVSHSRPMDSERS